MPKLSSFGRRKAIRPKKSLTSLLHAALQFIYCLSTSSSQDQELVGYLLIQLSFLLCKFLSRESCSLEFSLTGMRILDDDLWFRYTAFSYNKKMVSILHKELVHKVEKLRQMKLEVMQPKIKNKCELARE